MLEAIAIPSVEQYMAFGGSMLLFGIGLYAAASGMAVFLPAFLAFMAGLAALTLNPFAKAGLVVLGLIAVAMISIGVGAAMATSNILKLIENLQESGKIADIFSGLFGGGSTEVDAKVLKRVETVSTLIKKVEDSDIKSELENLALITTGVSANMMTTNAVSNINEIANLAKVIKNVLNAEITITLDKTAMATLIEEGVYKTSGVT
jgi:hypothetical protein